ncbi:MAG TPA: hypothetical protein VF622_14505 [Segetibacter sp.]
MKASTLLVFLFLPFCLVAQYDYRLDQPLPANSYLLKSGENSILIHPMDLKNKAHRWVTFDSTLKITSNKKLITPDPENIISQAYLEAGDSIIRIDQYLIENELRISAFTFDVKGNLLISKDIEVLPVTGKKVKASPFYVLLSPDRNSIALVQTLVVEGDSLAISKVVFTKNLNTSTNAGYMFPFNSLLSDMYLPIVSNNGSVIIVTSDKFNSYKLGSIVNVYQLSTIDQAPKTLQYNFDRRKIKGLNFDMTGDTLFFSGLFSEPTNKDEVAGVFQAGFDLKKQEKLAVEEYTYTGDVGQQLKKMYGTEGRKGNHLNYISFLPKPFLSNNKYRFAVLVPMLEQVQPRQKASPAQLKGLEDIKQQLHNVNSLLGTQPQGYSRPMTIDQATTYAAMNYNPSYVPSNPYGGWTPKPSKSRSNQKQSAHSKNLLLFSFKDSSNKFVKFKPPSDPKYQFFTFLPNSSGYSALHYVTPNFGKAYLISTAVNTIGIITEKKIFEDKSKVLLPDYPVLANKNSLVAFYENTTTGEMGLVKIRL